MRLVETDERCEAFDDIYYSERIDQVQIIWGKEF